MTDQALVLRKATMADAKLLLLWRNDIETRIHSRSHEEVTEEEHITWLTDTLSGEVPRLLCIAEIDGAPVGTVRSDRQEDGAHEISYTVAPEARGKGIAKRMVATFVHDVLPPGASLVAHVQKGHIPSERVAESLGLRPVREVSEGGSDRVMVEWR